MAMTAMCIASHKIIALVITNVIVMEVKSALMGGLKVLEVLVCPISTIARLFLVVTEGHVRYVISIGIKTLTDVPCTVISQDLVAAYSCNCVTGFNGDNCETNINDCTSDDLCQNGGTCVVHNNCLSLNV